MSKTDFIPLSSTGLFPRLVQNYLSGVEDMRPFFDYEPSLKGLQQRLAATKAQAKNMAVLSGVLEQQHGSELSAGQRENLHALRADAAYTVCTGHQLCLFSGPVYMIYKIVSIISLAERLSAESGERIIPVFWMASEDHDFDEVNHTYLYGKQVSWEGQHAGPVGPMPLDGIESSLDQLSAILGESSQAQEAMCMMRGAYSKEGTMSSAFRALVQGLFADKGLLILDADAPELKRQFIPQMRQELLQSQVSQAMAPTLTMLVSRGERVQAPGREINLFYMLPGSRQRIVKKGDAYATAEQTKHWTEAEILRELEVHPERFSPNVLMRPVYQEVLLPNLAYIGGPGELSYWLQLKEVFTAFGLMMPVLLLRDSFLLLDSRAESKLASLGFGVMDLFRDTDALHKEYARKHAAEEPSLLQDKNAILGQFDQLIDRSVRIDPNVVKYAQSERQKLLKAIDNLEKKLLRSEKKKHTDSLDKITQIKEKLLPGGGLIERKENYLHWYMKKGHAFFDSLYASANPLQPGIKIIRD